MSEPYKHWMYNIETGEGVLFNSRDEYNPEKWVDTPAKCGKLVAEDADVIEPMSERDYLKEEATKLGLEFASNIKTDKLKAMIAEAKGE